MFETDGYSPTLSARDAGAGDSGDANQDINYSSTTDDQILDYNGDDEDADDSGSDDAGDQGQAGDEDEVVDLNADEQGDGEDGEGQDDEDGAGEEAGKGDEQQTNDEQIPDASEDPAALRQAFKAHPELRNAYYSERAFREVMPTVAEARQYKEALPTIEDVQTAVAARDDLAEFDATFYTEGKETEFIGRLAQTDEAAFQRIAQAFPSTLYQLNPESYRANIATPAITATLGNLMALANQRGDQGGNLRNAIEVISMALFNGKRFAEVQGGQQGQPLSREAQELQQLRSRIQQQEQNQQTQVFTQFHTGANEQAISGIEKAITAQLLGDPKAKIQGLLKGSALEKNEKAIKRIGTEIWSEIDASLKANKGLTQMLRNEFKAAKTAGYAKEAQAKIANILISRARQLLPTVAKRVVGEFTELTVGSNQQRLQTIRKSARVDVSGAAGDGRPRGNVTPRVTSRDLNYRKTSDDDILDGKVTLRKR